MQEKENKKTHSWAIKKKLFKILQEGISLKFTSNVWEGWGHIKGVIMEKIVKGQQEQVGQGFTTEK